MIIGSRNGGIILGLVGCCLAYWNPQLMTLAALSVVAARRFSTGAGGMQMNHQETLGINSNTHYLNVKLAGEHLTVFPNENNNEIKMSVEWTPGPLSNMNQLPTLELKNGATAALNSEARFPFLGSSEAYRIRLWVPPKLNLNFQLFGGETRVEGMKSQRLKGHFTGATFQSDTPAHQVHITSMFSSVNLTNLLGDCSVNSMGGVGLGFKRVTAQSRISVETTWGDIHMKLPRSSYVGRIGLFGGSHIPTIEGAYIKTTARMGNVYLDVDREQNPEENNNDEGLRI